MKNILLIFLSVLLFSCEKENIEPTIAPLYEIQYFVQVDSAYIQYNIVDSNYTQYVSDWDTLFTAPGGWTINIMVTSFSGDLYTGLVIDGDTVDGCLCGDWCLMGKYLQ